MTFAEWFTFKTFHVWFSALNHSDRASVIGLMITASVIVCVVAHRLFMTVFNALRGLPTPAELSAQAAAQAAERPNTRVYKRLKELEERVSVLEAAQREQEQQRLRAINVGDLPS